jgi:TP901 family phage tail tape measure protein
MTQGDDVLDFVIRGKDEFSPTAKKASESALTAARDIDRANAQVSRSADDTTHHMTGMSRGISGAGDVARVSGGHFTSMGGALSKTGEHARTAGGHFGVLGTALSGLTSPFRRATSQAEGFASTLVKLSGLGSIIATGLGAGLAAGAVALAKFQLSQEDLWDSIQGNIGATDKQMNVMRQSANRLARETGQALETVAHGFERASNFGYKGAEGFKVVETAAKAAQITGGQTADVVNVLGRVMANFNVPARDAAKTMNILVASNAQANSSLDVFGMNFQRVSSYAAGLKIPLTQASGAFALLARNMPAPQAAAGLTAFLRGIVQPSSNATAELDKLSKKTGIDLVRDFSASGLASKGLTGVLADLHKATNGNVAEMQHLIAGTRGVPAAALLAGQGFADYAKNVDAAATSHGHLEKTFTEMAGQWDDTLDRIREVGKQILASISGPVTTGMAGPLHAIEGLLNGLLARMPDIVKGFSGLGAAISPAFDAAKQAVGAFASWLPGALSGAWSTIGPAAQKAGSDIGAAFSQIGPKIGPALAGIKTALTPAFDGIVGAAQVAFDKLPGILSGVGAKLGPIAADIGKKVSTAFDTITAPRSLDAMAGALRSVQKAAEDLGKGFSSTFQGSKDLDSLLKSLSKSGDQIGDSLHRAGVQLGLFGDSAGGKGANNLRDFGALLGKIANVTLVGLGEEIQTISKFLSIGISLIGGIGKTLMDTFTDVKKVFGDMGQLADDLIHGHWDKIAPDAKAIFMDVVKWAEDTGRDLLRTFVNVGEDIVGPKAMGRIIDWAKSAPGRFMGAISALWTELPAKAKDAAGNMMSGMAGKIKDGAGALKTALGNAVTGALNAALDYVKSHNPFDWLKSHMPTLSLPFGNGGGPVSGPALAGGGGYASGSQYGPFGGFSANYVSAGDDAMLSSLGVPHTNPLMDTDFPAAAGTPFRLPPGGAYQMVTQGVDPNTGGYEVWRNIKTGGTLMFLHAQSLSGASSGQVVPGGAYVGTSGHPLTTAFGNDPGFYHLCVVSDTGQVAWLSGAQMAAMAGQGARGGGGAVQKGALYAPLNPATARRAGAAGFSSTSEPVKVHVVADDTHSRAGLEPSIRYAADLPRGGHRAPPIVGDPLPLGVRYARGLLQRGHGPSLMDWALTPMDYTGDWRTNPALTGHYSGYQGRMALQGAPYSFAAGPTPLRGVPGGTMGGLLPRDPYGTFNAAYSAYGGIGRQISSLAAPSTLAGLPKDLRDQMRDAAKGVAAEFRDAGRTLNHDIAAENTRHRNALGQINGQAITKQEQELQRHQAAMAKIGDRTSAAAGAETRRHEAIDRGISTARSKQLEAENAERNRNIAQLKETYREHVNSLKTELTAFQKGMGTLLSPAAIFAGFQQMFQGRVANAQAAATLSYWRGQAPAPIAPGAIRAADQLRSMDVASARGQIFTSRATGDLAGFQAGLQALDAAIRTQLISDILRSSQGLSNHAAQLAHVAEEERLTAIGAAAMNLRIDSITRSFDGFMSDLDAAGSAIRSEILAGAMAGGGVNQTYLDGLVAVTDAQEAGANAQNGLNLMVAAARSDIAGMAAGLQTATQTLTDRWTRAVMDGYGAMNQFTPGLIKAAQAARDLATGEARRDVILGQVTHSFEQMSSGLSTLFQQAQTGLSFFGAMIGRGGDVGENIVDLAKNALGAATNLGTFTDMLSGFGTVLSQLEDVAARQVAFGGGISPQTFQAYATATDDQRKAMWDQIQTQLQLTHSTQNLAGYQTTLGNEVQLQTQRVEQLGLTQGQTSAAYLQQLQVLKDMQKEQEGLGLAMQLLTGDTTLTADQIAEANWAIGLFTSGMDPAMAALGGMTGGFTATAASTDDMRSAFDQAKDAASSLGAAALADAGLLGTFGAAVSSATMSLQQLIASAGASALSATAPGMGAPFGITGGMGGGSSSGGRGGAQQESADIVHAGGNASSGGGPVTIGGVTYQPFAGGAAGVSTPTPTYSFSTGGGGGGGGISLPSASSGGETSSPYSYTATHGILTPAQATPVAIVSVSADAAKSMGTGISAASSSTPVAVTTPALRAINPQTGLPGGPFYTGDATAGLPVGMRPMSQADKDAFWANAKANAGTATGMDKFAAAQLFPTLAAEVAATANNGYSGININGFGLSTYNGEIQVPAYMNNPSLLTGMGTGMQGIGSMGTGSPITGQDLAAYLLNWQHGVQQYMAAYGLGVQGANGSLTSPIDFSQNPYYNALTGAGALPNAGNAGYDPNTGLFANPQTPAQMNWNTRMATVGPNQNASGFQVNRALGPGVWNAGNGYIAYTDAPALGSPANMYASGMFNGMTGWYGGPNAFGPVDPNAPAELGQANPLLGLKFGYGGGGTPMYDTTTQQVLSALQSIDKNTAATAGNTADLSSRDDMRQWLRDLNQAFQNDRSRRIVGSGDFRDLFDELGFSELAN